MAQITSSEELEAWLKGKPADWAQVIAARAALRVLPYAVREQVSQQWVKRYTLSLMRAVVVTWTAHSFPTHNMVMSATAARTAYSRAIKAARAASARFAYPEIHHDLLTAAARAVDAAVDAAAFAPHAASDAYYTTVYAKGAIVADCPDSRVVAGRLTNALVAARAAASTNSNHDCNWLTSEGDPASAARRLTRERLWPAGEPEGWNEARTFMGERLTALNQGYGVWIEWYDRRVTGNRAAFDIPGDSDRTEDKKILARLADATNEDFWDKGATYVNTTLQGWIDEARERVRPRDAPFVIDPLRQLDPAPEPIPPQNQNAITFTASESGKIKIDQSRNADALRTDGDAQDRHAEAIREAKALLARCRLSNSAARFVSGFENYLSAGGNTLADLRPSLFVQRGEKLRQEIAAYEGGAQDSFLEPIADDLLIDLKGWRSAHNMAVGLDPVLMRIDTAILGPDVKPTLIAPSELHAFVADADEADILDEGVREIVDEAIDLAPAIPDANDRRTVWSVESVQNLVIEAFSVALNHPGKAVVGAAAAAVVLPKVTVFGAVAAGVTGFLPAAKFLINYRDWIETKLNNTPAWKSLFIQLCDSLQDVTPFKPKSGDDGV